MSSSGQLGAQAPFLNDYKLQFFLKRFPQTLTGGLRFQLDAPFYVYLYQIILFLWPVVFGGLFTALTEFDFVKDDHSCYIYGGIMALSLASAHLATFILARQSRGTQIDNNVLSDENDVDFVSCCDVETLRFILPAKTHILSVFTHATFSGIVCALSFLYLLPSAVNQSYSSTGTIVTLCVLGWLSVVIAHHSLMVQPPPETATFRTLDHLQLSSLTRPFYVGIIALTGVLARHYSELHEVSKVLYVALALLPLLWVIGFLPPLDALFPWLGEYLLVFALGGSYSASDFRLLVILFLSGVELLVACFIEDYVVLIIYSSICGFMLSLDLFHLFTQLYHTVTRTMVEDKMYNKWGVIDIIKHTTMLVIAGAIAGIAGHNSEEATKSIFDVFGYVFIVLLIVVKILSDLQCVYILGGLLRNPLYIKTVTSVAQVKKSQQLVKYFGQVYNIILRYVCPLLLTAFLGFFLSTSKLDLNEFFITLGIVRAMRWVWQNTWRSLCEVTILCIITWCEVDLHWWNTLGIGLQLLIIGFIWDRFLDFLQKIMFMLTTFITSWTEPKQRHKATMKTFILSAIFFPVLLSILIISTALSAPLLPLFCFPIFLVGFPRPKRMWPLPTHQSSSTSDGSVFYQQLVPKIYQTLKNVKGTLLDKSDFILVRYQDRLLIFQVVESGYKYRTVIARGLELQETSCHTVEAGMVDEIFEEAFCKERVSTIGLNHHALNTLTPLDCLVVETYSDAHNVLTGVIDQPENIKKQSSNFIKCLIWVLLTHRKKPQQVEAKRNEVVEALNNTDFTQSTDTDPQQSEVIDLNTGSKEALVQERSSTATTVQVTNLNTLDDSWSDKEWSDEDDDEDKDKTDSSFRADEPFSAFGLPAQDIGKDRNKGSLGTNDKPDKGFLFNTAPTKVAPLSMNHFQDSTSELTGLDPPQSWAKLLASCKRSLQQIHDSQFPVDWYNYVSKTLEANEEILIQDSNGLLQLYKDVVMSCFGMVNVFGLHGTILEAGPAHIYRTYYGRLPWSPQLDLLEKDSELKQLVLQAYRYAFKLTYDEAVLGVMDSEEELLETLNDYKENWFIGVENDPCWHEAILQEKPTLFSMGFDEQQERYTSHVLTKQELVLYTGRLNGEAIHGQWASLMLELLYLTNDDEERYSIQAHPVLLRNLTIQSADPPLGYAVYSSGAVHVSSGLL